MSVNCRVGACVYKSRADKCVLKQITVGPEGNCIDSLHANVDHVYAQEHPVLCWHTDGINLWVNKKGIYCRMRHEHIKDLEQWDACLDCPLLSGSMQGNGYECCWDDVELSYADYDYDPQKELLRVDNLIKNGVLGRSPSREGVEYAYDATRFLRSKGAS